VVQWPPLTIAFDEAFDLGGGEPDRAADTDGLELARSPEPVDGACGDAEQGCRFPFCD
jgi:hypothetical protein